jgi:hypothetical protein
MTDDVEDLVAEMIDSDSAAAQELARDLRQAASPEEAPPEVLARVFRMLREMGRDDLAAKHRADLHRHAENGGAKAQAVLAVLARTDPWWR